MLPMGQGGTLLIFGSHGPMSTVPLFEICFHALTQKLTSREHETLYRYCQLFMESASSFLEPNGSKVKVTGDLCLKIVSVLINQKSLKMGL